MVEGAPVQPARSLSGRLYDRLPSSSDLYNALPSRPRVLLGGSGQPVSRASADVESAFSAAATESSSRPISGYIRGPNGEWIALREEEVASASTGHPAPQHMQRE